MTAADRLALLDVMGVTVTLRDGGAALDIKGRDVLVQATEPVVRKHRDELIAHLRIAGNMEPTTWRDLNHANA